MVKGPAILLQARPLPCPGHLAQLEQRHFQARARDIGEIQIKFLGQRPELPVHADGYTKGVRQAAFFLGCSDEPGQRIGFGLSGVFGSCRPLFGLTNRLLRRSDNLHRCRQIEIRAFQNGALVEPAEVGSEVNTAVALSLVAASHFRISSLKEMYSFAPLLSRASSKIVSPTSPESKGANEYISLREEILKWLAATS